MTILLVLITIPTACQMQKKYFEYKAIGNEFIVSFYDKPSIKASKFPDFDEFETAELVLPSEHSFQRCETFLLPETMRDEIDKDFVFNMMSEYARFQGLFAPEMHYEVTDLGKIGTLRAYKELEDEKGKIWEITYFSKAVFGEKSGMILYVGSPSENYPTPEISKFLNSVYRISK